MKKHETPGMYLRRKMGAQQGTATQVLNLLVDEGYLSHKDLRKVVKRLMKRNYRLQS